MPERKPKIVVIDDNEVLLEVTKAALRAAGFAVVTHDRPSGCVALILHEKPDLVLMDVNMPGLGGDTLIGVLRKAAPKTDTVMLLHSSLSAEALRSKATAAGAHGFIQKSSDQFGLVREVNRWIKKSSSSNMRAAVALSTSDEAQPSGTRQTAAGAAAGPLVGSLPPSSASGGFPVARRPSGTLRIDAPTVLLVDDDMAVLSAFRRVLQTDELIIEFALSGGQALRRMLSDTPPDAVVCDMMLPDISGVDVYHRAVAADATYRARFMVATGNGTAPSVAAFLATFSGPVLYKPVEPSRLVASVRACLQGSRAGAKGTART